MVDISSGTYETYVIYHIYLDYEDFFEVCEKCLFHLDHTEVSYMLCFRCKFQRSWSTDARASTCSPIIIPSLSIFGHIIYTLTHNHTISEYHQTYHLWKITLCHCLGSFYFCAHEKSGFYIALWHQVWRGTQVMCPQNVVCAKNMAGWYQISAIVSSITGLIHSIMLFLI